MIIFQSRDTVKRVAQQKLFPCSQKEELCYFCEWKNRINTATTSSRERERGKESHVSL